LSKFWYFCTKTNMGTKHQNIVQDVPDEDKSAHRIALQSTGGLQFLLQQTHLRNHFRGFVVTTWVPKGQESSSYFRSTVRVLAINCLNFWVDVWDYIKLKTSSFRTYRATVIFERYLMHGALMQVWHFFKKLKLSPADKLR
jgi:hypothetical protein